MSDSAPIHLSQPPIAYASNCTISEVAEAITSASQRGRIVVVTHLKPDGDAAGSALGLARAIALLPGNKGVSVWHAGPLPAWLPDLYGATPFELVDRARWEPGGGVDPVGVAMTVIVDTGSWSQLEHVQKWIDERSSTCLIIDHHRQGEGRLALRRHVDASAAAACQLVAHVAAALLHVPVRQLPATVAEPLYLGLATDTGWFRHSNVTGDVMRIAADLIQAGAKPSALYQLVEQQDRLQRLKLLARAMDSLEVVHDGKIAVMTLNKQDFASTGATLNDSGGFVDFPALIASVRVIALLTETDDFTTRQSLTKISMRSKSGKDAVDVNAVAGKFGGGGHFAAAGGRTTLGLLEAKQAVIEAIIQQMQFQAAGAS
jgi:phosphoesterase RecJ-like protein